MPYDRDRQSGSEAVLIVVIVLLVLVGGLCVVGLGGYFFARKVSAQRQALLAQERAMVAREQAELARARAQVAQERNGPTVAEVKEGESLIELTDADAQHKTGTSDSARIAVRIDSNGHVQMSEERKSLAELRQELETSVARTPSMLSVDIQVDEDCLFKHVAKVLKLCESLDIKDVRLSSLSAGR